MFKTYTLHKEVQARPMTRGTYNLYRGWGAIPSENSGDKGYLVKHSEDYETWTPKDIFEKDFATAEVVDYEAAMCAALG